MPTRKMYLAIPLSFVGAMLFLLADSGNHQTITGKAAFTDYSQEKPGTFRKITLADLPPPFASQSVDNQPDVIARPANAWPQALPGFKVELYASGLNYPRLIRTAPNGDLFLAESRNDVVRRIAHPSITDVCGLMPKLPEHGTGGAGQASVDQKMHAPNSSW